MLLTVALSLCLLAGCGEQESKPTDNHSTEGSGTQTQEQVTLQVFAAASMTETLNEIKGLYAAVAPNVTLEFNFASSGDLLTQIKEGADCDLFISAAPKQMNALDGSLVSDKEKNPDGLDWLEPGSRVNLLENKVTLSVPNGNPKGLKTFDQLAELLKTGDVFLAVGNSDVPVGQYTQKIFKYFTKHLWIDCNFTFKRFIFTHGKIVSVENIQDAISISLTLYRLI